MEHCL